MDQRAPLEVGICVRDLEGMIAFYRDVLGLTYISTFEVPPHKSAPAGFAVEGYTIVRLQTPFGERIKLVKPGSDGPARERDNDVLGRQGAAFFTYIVADLPAMVSRLKAAGAEPMTEGEHLEVRKGVHLCNLRDPEGNFIEIVAYDDVTEYRDDLTR